MRRKIENEIGRHSAFLFIAALTFTMIDSIVLGLPAFIPRWAKFILAMSFVTTGLNVYDKIASIQKIWIYKKCRVPNLVLHLAEFLGGSIASLVLQLIMKHKSEMSYRQIQLSIIGLQCVFFMLITLHPEIPNVLLLMWTSAMAIEETELHRSSHEFIETEI
mmetsp:Transcript_5632/g.7851  ORF Transcript_5632/g.7851 Transcript_5632/m.7851 type:complete len:162 (-) Transcript_5632:239-724(-)